MSILSQGLKSTERKISNLIPHQHSADVRANMYASREQMQLYQEQKDALNKASSELSQQRSMESRKIHEKQIRALRNSYSRRSGLINPSQETTDNLG